MYFSHWIGPRHSWEATLATAGHVERTGWDGLWFPDHFMPDGEGDAVLASNLEGWTTLAALAAAVPRVRIGTLVVGNTYRNPALVAKMATTVDQVSGGRFVLGMGAGWQANEHIAYGFDFPAPAVRRDRLDEACRLIRELTTGQRTNFEGRYYRAVDAPCEPKPVRGTLPMLIGGQSTRLLEIVAGTADEWNVWGSPEFVAEKGRELDAICERVGRDPATVRRSAQSLFFINDDETVLAKLRRLTIPYPSVIGTPGEVQEVIGRYRDAGVEEMVLPDFNFRSPEEGRAVLDRFIEEVAAPFRPA